MQNYIDNVKNNHEEYLEQNTLYFENVAKINADGVSLTPQKKKMGERKIVRKIIGSLLTETRQIRVRLIAKQLNKYRAIKLNKLRVNKNKLQEIRLHATII